MNSISDYKKITKNFFYLFTLIINLLLPISVKQSIKQELLVVDK